MRRLAKRVVLLQTCVLVGLGSLCSSQALAITLPDAEAACGPHPHERLVLMKPEVCEKHDSVWRNPNWEQTGPSGQKDFVSVEFTRVPTTANQRILEIDVTCTCSIAEASCTSHTGPIPEQTNCPPGYKFVAGQGLNLFTCFDVSFRRVPPPLPPLTNEFTWTEGPFRITYDRVEGLSDRYVEAVKRDICACESRPTHKNFYQGMHQRCFGEQPNISTNSFVGSEKQFDNPDGTKVRCEILPEELARLNAQYQDCIQRNTSVEDTVEAAPTPVPTQSPVAFQPQPTVPGGALIGYGLSSAPE